MTLQQLLVLAGLTDRGTDPNALLGNFQNPFNLMSNITTPSPFVPPSPTAPAPSPLPPTVPSTTPLRDAMINTPEDSGGREVNDLDNPFASNPFAEIGPENQPSFEGPQGFTASLSGTPGFAANALGHALTMGLSAVPTIGPVLGLMGRMIGLPSIIAELVTPNIDVIPDFLTNDPLNPNNPSPTPTLSLDIETIGPSPAFSDFETLSSAPDEPGNESEGEDDGDGGDE